MLVRFTRRSSRLACHQKFYSSTTRESEPDLDLDDDDDLVKVARPKRKTSAPAEYRGRADSAQNPGRWKTEGTMMYYESPDLKPSTKIAAFGFNKCLVTTSIFRRGPDAWTLRYANSIERLKELSKDGYKLVIFTNHSPIGVAKTEETKNRAIVQQVGRTGSFIEATGLPFQIFIATAPVKAMSSDPFRKPAAGMWDFMVKNMNGGLVVDKDQSFYVGGAAGRPQEDGRRADHSDYDIKFASKVGVKFLLDEHFFDMNSKLPGPKMLFDRRKHHSEIPLPNATSTAQPTSQPSERS